MSWQSAARFYRQLALINRTGISLPQAVVMAGNVAGGAHHALAPAWGDACTGGSDLASAMARSGEYPLSIAMVRAGERSGRLPDMANMLADYYDHLLSLRSLILARLIYPACLLHVALLVPALPGVVLGTSPLWYLMIGPVLLWTVVGVVTAGLRLTHRSGVLARVSLRWPLRFFSMPLIVANSTRVLRAGLAAGMLVPDALELAAGACGNRAMSILLTRSAVEVRQGRSPNLASALTACEFPAQSVSLLANAEFAGRLEEVLQQVATLSDESFRTRSLYAAKIFTGTIYTVAMAVAVAVILSMAMKYYIQPTRDAMKEMDSQ